LLIVALTSALAGDALNSPARQWSGRAAAETVDLYRATVSPFFARTHLVRCRFSPTCSAYAREALLRHGFFPGAAMSAWRIARCNPLSRGGADPVP
jgi:putative membrane protein insertion efficiency factor